jgi:hypothetical protein
MENQNTKMNNRKTDKLPAPERGTTRQGQAIAYKWRTWDSNGRIAASYQEGDSK